jgi:hypothetical protein
MAGFNKEQVCRALSAEGSLVLWRGDEELEEVIAACQEAHEFIASTAK